MKGSISDSIVVGIYGVQGVGKSFIMRQIEAERIEWRIVDGSQLIKEALAEKTQTMEDFEKRMTPPEKDAVRKSAIEIAKKKPGVTLVSGHCSFRSTVQGGGGGSIFDDVYTEADGATYDDIIYLEKDVDKVFDQVQKDETRLRTRHSTEVLQKWVEHEKAVLESKCAEHGVGLYVFRLGEANEYRDLISLIVDKVVVPASERARAISEEAIVASIKADIPAADVYLLIDGDGTLCAQDTGEAKRGSLFFEQVTTLGVSLPLKKIFKRYGNYVFQEFLEVSMLYSKVVSTEHYLNLCNKIGREQVRVYDAWITFLDGIPSNVHPIIISCSIREIWLAMQSYHIEYSGRSSGLGRASIIAGNNLGRHSYIIDSAAKAVVAKTLHELHGGCRIIGFGDSALDVPMLCESDQAFVVVNDKMNQSMGDFIARQTCGGSSHCRLSQLIDLDPSLLCQVWHDGLPIQTLESLLRDLKTSTSNAIFDCATVSVTSEIIAAQTRDANLEGLALQQAHEKMGQLLADKLVDEFGTLMQLVETVQISHVQGGTFAGLRASNVVILPLMRGGEPMARGIYSRFPTSLFIHFYDGVDSGDQRNNLLAQAFERMTATRPVNIVVADSVVNTGSSIKGAISEIHRIARGANPDLQLVLFVLSGVMQEKAAELLPAQLPRVRFITLRVSKNQYKGVGASDTGNKLFGGRCHLG